MPSESSGIRRCPSSSLRTQRGSVSRLSSINPSGKIWQNEWESQFLPFSPPPPPPSHFRKVLFEFKDNKLQVQGFWRASPSSTVVSAFFDRDGEGLYCATQRDIFVFRGNFIVSSCGFSFPFSHQTVPLPPNRENCIQWESSSRSTSFNLVKTASLLLSRATGPVRR